MKQIHVMPLLATVLLVAAACSDTKKTTSYVEFYGGNSSAEAGTKAGAPAQLTAEEPDSDAAAEPLRLRGVGRYDEAFNDSNHVHLAEAERIGIEPLTDTRSFWHMRRPLVKIGTCNDFVLDDLTHSRPYLIPEAAGMVHEIGRRFRDTLQARGGGDYRILVTSVLRTPDGVRRLRRVNRNAVEGSVHQMGTTIDITYAKFIATKGTVPHRDEDLKGILAEVLAAMRSEGKLWVKYEKKQPCFHITVRNHQ